MDTRFLALGLLACGGSQPTPVSAPCTTGCDTADTAATADTSDTAAPTSETGDTASTEPWPPHAELLEGHVWLDDHARLELRGEGPTAEAYFQYLGASVDCTTEPFGDYPGGAIAVGMPSLSSPTGKAVLLLPADAEGEVTIHDAIVQHLSSAEADLGHGVRFVGDVDGDGDVELAERSGLVFSGRLTDASPADAVMTFRENPAGAALALHGALGDLDGDGRVDLLASNATSLMGFLGPSTLPHDVVESDAVLAIDADAPVHSAFVADLDEDGAMDVVAVYLEQVVVSFGVQPGTHVVAGSPGLVVPGSRAAVGDLNGDGVDDLVVAPHGVGAIPGERRDLAYVFFGPVPADGTLSAGDADVVVVPVARNSAYVDVLVADLNGDGFADLVLAEDAPGKKTVQVFSGPLSPGEMSFEEASVRYQDPYPHAGPGVALAACDLDHDGASELVYGASNAVVVPPPHVQDAEYEPQGQGRVVVVRGGPWPVAPEP